MIAPAKFDFCTCVTHNVTPGQTETLMSAYELLRSHIIPLLERPYGRNGPALKPVRDLLEQITETLGYKYTED
jgi:hypothetical protein